jgi:hypothetical protein
MSEAKYFNTVKIDDSMEDIASLKRKTSAYKEVLANTQVYRDFWKNELKEVIVHRLTELSKAVELEADIEVKSTIENLEAIVLSLGAVKSGIWENVSKDIKRDLIKHNGSLIYQQLFNGKIIVMISLPVIEGYGEPAPPKTIAIYRPEEIKTPYIIRHLEEFIKEITIWEDYDDDESTGQQKIGCHLNFVANEDNSK